MLDVLSFANDLNLIENSKWSKKNSNIYWKNVNSMPSSDIMKKNLNNGNILKES